MHSDATISRCQKYRYALRRTWDDGIPALGVVGLNPSTADATIDDPTVRKCVKFARSWGYGGIVLVNLFAWRATDKNELRIVADPVGPQNDIQMLGALAGVEDVLLAWGNDGAFMDRSATVRALLKQMPSNYFCIKLNGTGEPVHPLYQRDDSTNEPFSL